ncbi:hypothetical protein ACE14D_22705 [Streptomyces sp. Act-28]
MGLGIAAAAILLSVSACTESGGEPQASISSTAAAPPAPSAVPPSDSAGSPSVKQPPELDSTEKLAGRQQATRGNASFEYDAGTKGDALIVGVRCEGAGTMQVKVNAVDVTFPLECIAGKVNTTYNQVGVDGVERRGTVTVQAPSTVQWSMTVGRGEPAAQESPATDELS